MNRNIAVLKNVSRKGDDLTFEFNPKRAYNIGVGLGESSGVVRWRELYDFVVMTAKTKELQDLLFTRRVEATEYERTHRVKLLKDLKAGEELVVKCRIDIPNILKEEFGNRKVERLEHNLASPASKIRE